MSIRPSASRCLSKTPCGGCDEGSCSDNSPGDAGELTGSMLTGPLLTGWQFAATSAGCFLGPVVLAILGATSFGSAEGQLLGAIAGLAVGFGASWILIRACTAGQARSGTQSVDTQSVSHASDNRQNL